jgi:prepilin-type N-terminal cleavage/methylation domain-containing protein
MQRRAFTLVELLVALTVLLVVIIATARIFGTTSKVAAIGEASADLQATATAVEKIIRGDIERIARDGVLAIQCVAVRNDVNRVSRTGSPINVNAPLLDPTRAADEFIRCDQLVFFGRGHEASQVYLGTRGGATSEQAYTVNTYPSGGLNITPEFTSYEFMVRIGPAVQFPTLLVDVNQPNFLPDPDTWGNPATPPVPWMWGALSTGNTSLRSAYFNAGPNGSTYLPLTPEARGWPLSRQLVLMADDASRVTTSRNVSYFRQASVMTPNCASGVAQYGTAINGAAPVAPQTDATLTIGSADLYPNRAIIASRVDTAASTIASFCALVETGSTSSYLAKDYYFNRNGRLAWSSVEGVDPTAGSMKLGFIRDRIANALFGAPVNNRTQGLWGYPRAEKIPPSMNRTDAMLSVPLLAGNCSSIQIDWTWAPGTAQFETPDGTPLLATLPYTPTATPTRAADILDVPLSGLTTQNWPQQPFMPLGSGAIQVTAAQPIIPWFGLPDSMFPAQQRRGVTMLAGAAVTDVAKQLVAPSYAVPIQMLKPSVATDPNKAAPFTPVTGDLDVVAVATPPIDCARIEGTAGIQYPQDLPAAKYSVYSYQAIFGPNGSEPYREAHYPGGVERVLRTDYTPWPTALRFTVTLHDPKMAFSQGRVFQFVVELPKADKP